jgi:hypothetical protein
VEKIAAFFKALADAAAVVNQFPTWLKLVCFVSLLYFLIFGGIFIFEYSKYAALLKTSALMSNLEKQALSGQPMAMIELSLSESPKAFDILASVLKTNPQDQVRQQAAVALANLHDPRKTQALGDALLAEKWEVAGACAQALGRSNDPSAVPYLLRALQLHIDWVVAQKSAEALGNFPPSEQIAKALVTTMNEGESSFEAEAAKQSLVKFGRFSMPFLLANIEETTSVQGFTQSVLALRIVGEHDAAKCVESLKAADRRVAADPAFDDAGRKRLRSEIEAAERDLASKIAPAA